MKVIQPGARRRARDEGWRVTEVRSGGAILGASVWDSHRDDAVFVPGHSLRSVAQELLRLADEREGRLK